MHCAACSVVRASRADGSLSLPPAAMPSAAEAGIPPILEGESSLAEHSSSADAQRRRAQSDRMHYTSDQLQDVLRLAHGCLKSARLPGELREKDFFQKFDAEAARRQAAVAAVEERAIRLVSREVDFDAVRPKQQGFQHQELSPRPPTPDGLSTEAKASKLRRDAQRLERLTAERRQDFESVSAATAKEVLQRCRAQDELRAAQAEVQKLKKAVRDAREMRRIQEKEIKELQALTQLRVGAAGQGGAASSSHAKLGGPAGAPLRGVEPTAAEHSLSAAKDDVAAAPQLAATPQAKAEAPAAPEVAATPEVVVTALEGGEETVTCLPAEELATQMAPTGAADTEPSFGDPTVDAAPSVVVAATVMPPQIVKSPGAPPVASAYVEPPKMRVYSLVRSERPRNVKVYM